MRFNAQAVLATIVVSCLTVAACGGRDANPVQAYRYGDEKMPCNRIADQVSINNSKITALYKEEAGAESSNVALAAVGVVLFWPALFFLDTTDTEQIEIGALMDRNDSLMSIWYDNDCPGNPPQPLIVKPEIREQPDRRGQYDPYDPLSREQAAAAQAEDDNDSAAEPTYRPSQTAAAQPTETVPQDPIYGAMIASFMNETVALDTWRVYVSKYPALANLKAETRPVETDTGLTRHQLMGVSTDRDAVMAACTEIRLASEYCEVVDVEPKAAS